MSDSTNASIRVCALWNCVLLILGLWVAGREWSQFDAGGGLGAIGPGLEASGVLIVTSVLSLLLTAFTFTAAIRQKQRRWLAVFIAVSVLCLGGPFVLYAMALLLSPHHVLAVRGWVAAVVLFGAFLALSLVSLLYSFQCHPTPTLGETGGNS